MAVEVVRVLVLFGYFVDMGYLWVGGFMVDGLGTYLFLGVFGFVVLMVD